MGGTINMPEDLMTQVEQTAAYQQRSADSLVREAVERYLRRERRAELYAYGEQQARKLGISESQVQDLVEETRRESKTCP